MKLNIILIISILFIVSCSYDKRSKEHPSNTFAICNDSIFVKKYIVYAGGGALGGNMYSQYLTDSLNFRIYIGTYDQQNEYTHYECNGDVIKVYLFAREQIIGEPTNKYKIVNIRIYNLRDLRMKKLFE